MARAVTSAPSTTLIADRYELDLDQRLGTGGMSVVYRGNDVRTGDAVAIKTLRPEYAENPESIRRFQQEARMMAVFSHPNIVPLRGLEEDDRGIWMVMDLVEGRSLKELVTDEGPQSTTAVLSMLEQIASALDAMHRRKIVHLDIKPQNIMVDAKGHITIIDLGLAQPAGPHQEMVGGTAFGTVAYLAPEQASGEAVDATTDVYSLGCVIYELLTGRPPFEAPEGDQQKQRLIRAHLEELPTAPSILLPTIPGWVDDVVGWALAKPKGERYHDVATFARMFRSGIDGHRIPISRAGRHRPSEVIQETGTLTVTPPRLQPRGDPAPVTVRQPAPKRQRPEGPSVAEQLYRFGGRAIGRTRRMRGRMWRLAMIFAAGNLLLGGLLVVQDGPSDLLERFFSVAPGTETTVDVDQLNLRTGPGAEFEVLDVLPSGTVVKVTGISESTADGRWWPVEVTRDGETVDGWVWDGGLRDNAWTGRMSWMQEIVERGQAIPRQTRDVVDDAADLWPF